MASSSQLSSAPGPDELELSVFGPGYGECIVIHLGCGDWIIIDSCFDSEANKPAALAYLEKIGVDASTSVRVVIASHWDDDHVRGLAEVYRSCKAASFACSLALAREDFKKQMATFLGSPTIPGGSGLDEILAILKERRTRGWSTPEYAAVNTLLWRRSTNPPAEVLALSPSNDGIISAIGKLVAASAKDKGLLCRLPKIDGNHASVVLCIQAFHHFILLGGDLQIHANPALGWEAVIRRANTLPTFGTFKISHHGSPNGDHDQIWAQLLSKDPIAIVTPLVNGRNSIPSLDDCRRILKRTEHSFITSPPFVKYKDDVPIAQREVRERLDAAISEQFSQIRLRWSNDPNNPAWKCERFGRAMPLNDCVDLLIERGQNVN